MGRISAAHRNGFAEQNDHGFAGGLRITVISGLGRMAAVSRGSAMAYSPRFTMRNGLPNNSSLVLSTEDSRGTVWAGTDGGGLVSDRPRRRYGYITKERWPAGQRGLLDCRNDRRHGLDRHAIGPGQVRRTGPSPIQFRSSRAQHVRALVADSRRISLGGYYDARGFSIYVRREQCRTLLESQRTGQRSD